MNVSVVNIFSISSLNYVIGNYDLKSSISFLRYSSGSSTAFYFYINSAVYSGGGDGDSGNKILFIFLKFFFYLLNIYLNIYDFHKYIKKKIVAKIKILIFIILKRKQLQQTTSRSRKLI